ncbi:MAG TPA: Rid family hydrolase [Beijerinckiaceae bacterium]|nr:Rid family hydrolase [Beijerinckiaceae bacterium]
MTSNAPAAPLARYAAWKRRGDFIFMSGIIAVDPALGKVVMGYDDIPVEAQALLGRTGEMSVDVKEGPILAQSWYVLDKIRQTIEGCGGSMGDVFKLVQYFRDLRDYPHYNRVRKLFYPTDPPVSTVVEVSAMLPNEHILVEVEATAWLPLI